MSLKHKQHQKPLSTTNRKVRNIHRFEHTQMRTLNITINYEQVLNFHNIQTANTYIEKISETSTYHTTKTDSNNLYNQHQILKQTYYKKTLYPTKNSFGHSK